VEVQELQDWVIHLQFSHLKVVVVVMQRHQQLLDKVLVVVEARVAQVLLAADRVVVMAVLE